MPAIEFNRYYRYDELTKLLQAFAKDFPDFVDLSSIGKSHEGRDIWLVTVTNKKTGPASDKPAFWSDGNIHASEVSASTAVLHLLNRLVHEPAPLASRAFYLVPRLNPDGAEWALESPPRVIRSSTRPYPYDEEDPYGLERKDIDGDGRILNMRVKDPTGPWKISELDSRLLRRRNPGDIGGTYYRLMPEGIFHNFDGTTLRARKVKESLDINRNFPGGWRQEFEQRGAGPFPTSEPEIRAAVAAITERPNICGAVTFHTFSGVNLRPPSRTPDDDIPAEDLWVFKKIGAAGTEITGYPAVSVYHEFRYHPKEVISGVFDDWMYEHRGVFAWTTEIWSPQRQAGITDYKFIEWFRDHPHEDDIKLLNWSDEKLGGRGYIDWKPFNHPQLGEIEIGGWDASYAFRNPPPDFLEAEVTPLTAWVVWQAMASPKLEIRDVLIEPAGDAFRIRLVVHNSGWLPTNVAKIAVDRKLCRGVVGEITREGESTEYAGRQEPSWLVSGRLREDAGQLTGWSHTTASGFAWGFDESTDVAVFEWVIKAGEYLLVAKHERAGTVRRAVKVG
jgi:murein tripeptide amidase MpaA